MNDYISREAMRPDAFCEGVSCQDCPFCKDPVQGGCRIDDFVMSIPAADVVEVRHGQWLWNGGEDMHYYCSYCYHNAYGCTTEILDGIYRYCPSCGAVMDGGQDE